MKIDSLTFRKAIWTSWIWCAARRLKKKHVTTALILLAPSFQNLINIVLFHSGLPAQCSLCWVLWDLVILNHSYLSLLCLILSLFWPNNDEELNRVWNIFPHSPIKGQFTQIIYPWFNRKTQSLTTSCHTGCWQTCNTGRESLCVCVGEGPNGAFLGLGLCFAANAAISLYLWWFLC